MFEGNLLRRMGNESDRLIVRHACLFALLATLWSVAAAADPPSHAVPSIAFSASGIAISGLTPGGSAIVLGIERGARPYITGYTRHNYLLRSADTLGNARINLTSVSPISLWCVVDLQTGTYASAGPAGYAIRRIPLPANAFHAASNAQLNRLRLKDEFLEVLWVRPNVGFWKASAGDGGASDSDHAVDGHVSLAPEQMEPLGQSPIAPNHYLPTDTFILINPETMEILTLPVTQ
jgi:hypothetical protein